MPRFMPGNIASAQLVPDVGFVMTFPDWLMQSARLTRIHNTVSKLALRRVLMKHHKERIPDHFKQTNRNKYDHKERSSRTKAYKRRKFGSITDLVKTGRTRQSMTATRPQVQIGGSGATVMTGKMFMRFPFSVDLSPGTGKTVTPAVMAAEIARWTETEAQEAAEDYRNFYVDEFEKATANSPRLRKQTQGALAALKG